MSTLLINGCSYAEAWGNTALQLGTRLWYDETVNLGFPGGSNDRTFRTTIEYCLMNPDVKFVIIMLTFWGRSESPWCESIPIEGPWVSYGPVVHFDLLARQGRGIQAFKNDINTYVASKILVDHQIAYADKILTNFISLIGWLESRGINYCAFGTADKNWGDQITTVKRNEINKNKKVIDIFNWSSNQYLYEHGGTTNEHDRDIDPLMRHYSSESHSVLNDYIYDHINKHCL